MILFALIAFASAGYSRFIEVRLDDLENANELSDESENNEIDIPLVDEDLNKPTYVGNDKLFFGRRKSGQYS